MNKLCYSSTWIYLIKHYNFVASIVESKPIKKSNLLEQFIGYG